MVHTNYVRMKWKLKSERNKTVAAQEDEFGRKGLM